MSRKRPCALTGARHSRFGDSRGDLDSASANAVLLQPGDSLHLTFQPPPRTEGHHRIFVAGISGQYVPVGQSARLLHEQIRDFDFGPNYPNPANPSTQFSFAVPSSSRVTIRLYNILGQVVTTVADEVYPPGRHTVSWDGLTNGHPAATGVYFAKMTAGAFTATRKVLVVK